MNIINRFKQYGFKNGLSRTVKMFLRLIGIQIESYFLYKQEINLNTIKHVIINPKYTVRRLNYYDFNYSKGLIFNSFKLDVFKKRFEEKSYLAYGVYDGDKLIYSTWISTNQFEVSVNNLGCKLNSDEGLLLDIITHADYRKQGLHNFMNIYCLERIKELGKSKAVVIVLKENIPARKSQKRSGFRISKKITYFKFWGMERKKIIKI
jgi:hypothetical protein